MEQVILWLLFFIVVEAGVVSVAPEVKFDEIMKSNRRFSCGPPQPRSFSIKEIFGEHPADRVNISLAFF